MSISIVGIDLAKNIFHFHGVDSVGKLQLKARVYRSEMTAMLSKLSPCRVVMEACSGSNYWAREAEGFGHRVDLIAPQYVKPFVQRNKNDWKDAEAITVAAQQPRIRYVPHRSQSQQDLQNLHRVRERLVKTRTALVNEMRGFLHEYGIVMAQGRRIFQKTFIETLDKNQDKLTPLAQETLYDLWDEYHAINSRIERYENKLESICNNHPICQRLIKMPGIGFLTATAIISSVNDATIFKNGREFAAWLGLTPREHSTGGKQRLGRISKRGDSYLRKLLIHGARITLRYVDRYSDKKSVWAKDLKQRKGMNRSAVAVANKNARIIWALISRDEEYKTFPLPA